jgi:hypothetical protein
MSVVAAGLGGLKDSTSPIEQNTNPYGCGCHGPKSPVAATASIPFTIASNSNRYVQVADPSSYAAAIR